MDGLNKYNIKDCLIQLFLVLDNDKTFGSYKKYVDINFPQIQQWKEDEKLRRVFTQF